MFMRNRITQGKAKKRAVQGSLPVSQYAFTVLAYVYKSGWQLRTWTVVCFQHRPRLCIIKTMENGDERGKQFVHDVHFLSVKFFSQGLAKWHELPQIQMYYREVLLHISFLRCLTL